MPADAVCLLGDDNDGSLVRGAAWAALGTLCARCPDDIVTDRGRP